MLTQLKQFRLRLAVIATGIAALVMLLPAVVQATPSTITSVAVTPAFESEGATDYGPATVYWSLPAGHINGVIEVAVDPATGADGGFYFQNLTLGGYDNNLTTSQTSWTNSFPPGTFYVHVYNCPDTESMCFPSPSIQGEWSNIYTFVVPNSAPPPSSKPGSGPGPGGKKLPKPKCKDTRSTVRYKGTSRQGRGVCFLVSRNGKQVKLAWFGWAARCGIVTWVEGTTKMLGRGTAPVRNGRFTLSSTGSISALFKGKIKGRKASGVLSFKESSGCSSGKVRWTARKG